MTRKKHFHCFTFPIENLQVFFLFYKAKCARPKNRVRLRGLACPSASISIGYAIYSGLSGVIKTNRVKAAKTLTETFTLFITEDMLSYNVLHTNRKIKVMKK